MKTYKKTEAEVRREVAQLKEEIEILRQLAREQGLGFSSLNEEQLFKKVRGQTSKSPFSYSQGWTSATFPGNTANFTLYVRNPDPTAYYPVFVTIFFGLGSFFGADQAWIGRDKRWPEFSSDRTNLAANSNQTFSFSYTLPTGLPRGTYLGNSVLWQGDWHGAGVAFERSMFDVKVL
jgi:hypothetical protein